MRLSRSSASALFALIASAALLPIAATPAEAKSKKSIERKEDDLAAAGFLLKPANTPKRTDMLSRLPANKFVKRVNGDTVTYVYADPKACNCLYVGSQQAYGQYLQTKKAENLVNQQSLNALDYSDSAWDWGAWGPWGRGWGFGRRGW
jgi:hypothetical protein